VNPPVTAAASVAPMSTAEPDRSFFGHPRGLATLFFTEMWERFSYYGMRAFLILYMTAPASAGGLALSDASAGSIYGTYTGMAWGAAIVGGLIADRLLGQYRSVLIGGIIIALGHFTLVFKALPFFYTGLVLIVAGTGLLKPSVSVLVGGLYDENDARRDAGFSLFYMGINIGATLGPLIAGYLAQRVDWHVGFACAGVGMALGLVQYIAGKRRLAPALARVGKRPNADSSANAADRHAIGSRGFTSSEWMRITAILILFVVAILFWGGYEQAGSTINLFADRYTRLELFGLSFPSSWFQAVPAMFVIVLAPTFAWVWLRLGRYNPSVPIKFALGLLFMGLGFLLLLMPAGAIAQSGGALRVSPWWVIAWFFMSELGELCLYPVGLSAVSRLSPMRIVGVMMGVWFLSIAFGDKLAGWAAGFISNTPLPTLFGVMGLVLLAAAAVMLVLTRPINRLSEGT